MHDILDVPRTIAELAFFAGGRFPRPDLLGRCSAGATSLVSGREVVERVRDISLGLAALGMQPGDRVVLLSESRPEWLLIDLAILAGGGVTTPIYPTLSADQIGALLRDSEAVIAVVSTPALLTRILEAGDVPALRCVLVIDGAPVPPPASRMEILSLDDVSGRGHRQILDGWGVGRAFQERAKAVRPSDPATLIYTSGTTGTPKGVLLTHANLVANVTGIREVLHLDEKDTSLSFLPLCHAFERMVAYVYLTCGVSMMFAESIETVARDLKQVRPTVMTGVPRVFEKLHDRIMTTGHAQPGLTSAVFDWTVGVAEQRAAALAEGREPSWWLSMQTNIAERLTFQKIRENLGGRLRFAVSGGAPLRPEIGRFFYGVGLKVLEGYGLTETSPVVCVMPIDRVRFGTVGPPLPNVELRIAADGEIMVRGPNVMQGYYKREAETAAVLRDGWFATGDIGAIDEAGFLRITDRKKELLVTSGGKKIAPQAIEAALKAQPGIEEAVLIADQRHFATALLVPNVAAVCRTVSCPVPSDDDGRRALVARDDVRALMKQAVESVNAKLAHFEQIKKFAVLSSEFSQATGELTPTLKVKRRVVEQKYRADIEQLYA